jgi:hypothetical protein
VHCTNFLLNNFVHFDSLNDMELNNLKN